MANLPDARADRTEPSARTDDPAHADPAATRTPTARAHGRGFYAEARRHAARDDDAHAFVPDPAERGEPNDDLAEELGEDFLTSATSGEEAHMETLDEPVPEEEGGPFLEVDGAREFASGSDPSNPRDAEPEPFPRANASPRR